MVVPPQSTFPDRINTGVAPEIVQLGRVLTYSKPLVVDPVSKPKLLISGGSGGAGVGGGGAGVGAGVSGTIL